MWMLLTWPRMMAEAIEGTTVNLEPKSLQWMRGHYKKVQSGLMSPCSPSKPWWLYWTVIHFRSQILHKCCIDGLLRIHESSEVVCKIPYVYLHLICTFPPCEAGSWLPLNFWRSGWLNKSLRVIALKDLCEKVKWKWEKLHVDLGRVHTYLCGWKFLCPSTNASIESSSLKWAVQSYSMARAQGWLGIGRTGRPQEQKEEHFPHWGLVTSQLVKSSGGWCLNRIEWL